MGDRIREKEESRLRGLGGHCPTKWMWDYCMMWDDGWPGWERRNEGYEKRKGEWRDKRGGMREVFIPNMLNILL